MKIACNRLDIVFVLETELDEPSQGTPDSIGRRVIKGGLSQYRVFEIIVEIIAHLGLSTSFITCRDGRRFSTEGMLRRLARREVWGGPIKNETISFDFFEFPAYGYSHLSIIETVPGAATDWEQWADPFLREKWFSQAWLSDVAYDYWQNAEHPFQYESARKSSAGLPMRSNGLPPPLEAMVIDISRNPGRRIVHEKYIEAIGATMWLGKPFWEVVGLTRKSSVMSSDLLRCDLVENGVLKVKADNDLFNDGSSVRLQNELRKLLYG